MKQLLGVEESKMIVDFVLTVVFSLLIGIERNNQLAENEREKVFGTDRTFAFISTLGYILFIITPHDLTAYLSGFFVIGALLVGYYVIRLKTEGYFGMTAVILALLMYALPAFIITEPRWFSLLVIVIVMTLSEIKSQIKAFSTKLIGTEFLTLSKFLIITGVILPLVPTEIVIPYLNISPHRLWVAIVVISSISYVSYLLRKFIFPNAGLLLSGILGGLYSSTATIFILSRKSKDVPGNIYEYTSAILAANTLLFLRVWIIIFVFNEPLALATMPHFTFLFLAGAAITYSMYRKEKSSKTPASSTGIMDSNPLELKIAIIFAILYVVFSFVTSYTVAQYGMAGLTVLSYVVGLTDINPFIINLYQSHATTLTSSMMAQATINAVAGNTILHGVYSLILCGKELRKPLVTGYGILGLAVVAVSVAIGLGWM
ncbi:MAG TPA: DUF4010 domain-containing protein [Candidatus Kapabacteria bacterium]|nr:DUF4010 domain-containing protein [Candidatus Kapabacteria bacterium]